MSDARAPEITGLIDTQQPTALRQTERIPYNEIDEIVVAQIIRANFFNVSAHQSGAAQKPFDITEVLDKMGYHAGERDDYQHEFPEPYLATSIALVTLCHPKDPGRTEDKVLTRKVTDKPNNHHETTLYEIRSLELLTKATQGLQY